MSFGQFTFWFVFGCVVFLIAAAGFISTLMEKPPDAELMLKRAK